MNEANYKRLAQLQRQFGPQGRVRVTMDNYLDLVKVDDILAYEEDHGYQGSWEEAGQVIKITDRSIICRKANDKTSRLRLGYSNTPAHRDLLKSRRVYRKGTVAEAEELRRLAKIEREEEREQRRQQDIERERGRVRETIARRAKEDLWATLLPEYQEELRELEETIAKEYTDCPACGWPGRKQGQGCLRCSDGF